MTVSKSVSVWSLVVWREGNIVTVLVVTLRALMVVEVVECEGEGLSVSGEYGEAFGHNACGVLTAYVLWNSN